MKEPVQLSPMMFEASTCAIAPRMGPNSESVFQSMPPCSRDSAITYQTIAIPTDHATATATENITAARARKNTLQVKSVASQVAR